MYINLLSLPCSWYGLISKGLEVLLSNSAAGSWYRHGLSAFHSAKRSEANMTLAGKEKQGHCQLSLGDYEAKLNAMAVLALVEGRDPVVQRHRRNLQHHFVFR